MSIDYYVKGQSIILKQPDFSLESTLDCGQAFRFEKYSSDSYIGFAKNRPLEISENKDIFTFHNVTEEDFISFWINYFDFDTDYKILKDRFSEDETLCKAVNFAPGIRLLRQDAWETLFSFIISQNNNIPRIKLILKRLCGHFGKFPDISDLYGFTENDFYFLKAGFRAKYLADCTDKITSGEINLEKIKLLPTESAENELMKIKGVGKKVSACAVLFGMYKTDAFPVDTWIKKVMEIYYPSGLPECTKGYEGIAQQYLFHYIRNLGK